MNGGVVVRVENVPGAAIKKPSPTKENVSPNALEKHAYR
jgi:hypothetical protein